MNKGDELVLRISPSRAEAIVEMHEGGIVSRKNITADSLANCFLSSRYDEETHPTGLLPEGCIGVTMTPKYTLYFIRYPELHADFTYYETEYLVGLNNWHNDYEPWHGTGKKDSQICGMPG